MSGEASPTPSDEPSQFWTLDRVREALIELSVVNLPRGTTPLRRVWTDTRTVGAGDLFLALKGERFDGHEFVAEAVKRGVAAVVVSRPVAKVGELGVPVFEVNDTLVALGALARYRRRAWNGPVVCVAGTNGKTSTKELVRAALGSTFSVHATSGNFNNLVGVPLTLLAIPDSAEVAVVEIGTNQPGEIPRLRAIAEPTVTVITAIGEEHLEGLGDVAGVMREEMASCDGVSLAVVPSGQSDVVAEARARATRVIAAGVDDSADVRPEAWHLDGDGRGVISVDGETITVPARGSHNVRNAMLAYAVARELGVAARDAARGIASMTLPPMRVAWEQHGRATLINDAYNANPGSMRAALELLASTGSGRERVAILGSMRELGAHAGRLHDEIAHAALASGASWIGGVGELGEALERAAPGDRRVVTGADAGDVWTRLSSRLAADAVILIKGSRGVRLEQLVPAISAWAAARAGA